MKKLHKNQERGSTFTVVTNPKNRVTDNPRRGINPNDYDLVTAIQKRPIDATQQWRFTSIPNNAKATLG